MNKILIVDDHPENIQLLSKMLESAFPEIRLYQATEVNTALGLTNRISFDLIISDWDMPGKTGIDLVVSVKGDPANRHIPIIIVTAIMLTAHDLEVALEAGAHDYIRNPVDPLELKARVHAALTLSKCHLEEIREKNVQLMEKTLIHVRNNEFDIKMSRDLTRLLSLCRENKELSEALKSKVDELEQKVREDSWKNFEVAFLSIHTSFIKNLLGKYPDLTKGELRLCILLKLGMNTKDIASMLYLSPDSLKVSRSRLRGKLGMNEEDSFHVILSEF